MPSLGVPCGRRWTVASGWDGRLERQLIHEVIGHSKPGTLPPIPSGPPERNPFLRPAWMRQDVYRSAPGGRTRLAFPVLPPSDVASPYIHDTVSRIRAIFSAAIEKAPSIVFIDEFEAFVPARSELGGHQQYKAEEVNEFLANLEGVRNARSW